jgi:gluconolactonase
LQAAKPTLFAGTSARVEGPSWRGDEVFFAADGLGLLRADGQGKVFRYQPTLNPVGSFALADGSLLVCEKKYLLLQIFADGKIGVLVGAPGNDANAAAFCNDITVDGAGNVYFSDSRAGAIMKLTPAGDLTKWVTGRKYPNGLEVDRENKFLYFSDTGVNTLFRVPMTASGAAGAVESLGAMIADGMAIDAWGNLWLAQVTAGQAMVYDPNKRQIIARIDAGGPQSTNLTFGGRDNDTLFTAVAGKGIMRIAVGVRGFSHPGAAHYAIKSMLDLPPANTPAN